MISISDSESDGILAHQFSIDFVFVEEFSRGDHDWTIKNYTKCLSLNGLL